MVIISGGLPTVFLFDNMLNVRIVKIIKPQLHYKKYELT